jgi:hypothetical protein
VLRAFAVVLALVAAVCMAVAIAGMATGNESARTGWVVRMAALVCFVGAVILNVAAH